MAGKYCLIFMLAVLGIGNAMAFTHQTLSKVEMSQWLCGMTHNKLIDGKKQGGKVKSQGAYKEAFRSVAYRQNRIDIGRI